MQGPFRARLAALLEGHHGTGSAAFGAGEHLGELKAVMVSIAGQELEAFEAIFVSFARQLFETAQSRGEIAIERSGLSLEALIATMMRAAAGAKLGATPSCEAHLSRLGEIAAVFAAAAPCRPRRRTDRASRCRLCFLGPAPFVRARAIRAYRNGFARTPAPLTWTICAVQHDRRGNEQSATGKVTTMCAWYV